MTPPVTEDQIQYTSSCSPFFFSPVYISISFLLTISDLRTLHPIHSHLLIPRKVIGRS